MIRAFASVAELKIFVFSLFFECLAVSICARMAPKQGFADLPEGGRLLNSLDMLSMTSQMNALLRGLLIIHLLSFCSSCADSSISQKQNAPREVAALTPQQNAP